VKDHLEVMKRVLLLLLSLLQATFASFSNQGAGSKEASCGFPGLPAHASLTPPGQVQWAEGEVANFSCSPGYVMFGPMTRLCQNGEWSGGSPVCRQNVALAQTASQSDTLWDYTAGLAVDGEENSTCSFTPRTPDQRWWQVQLKEAINTIGGGCDQCKNIPEVHNICDRTAGG